MQTLLRFVPGIVGALCAFSVSKLFAWTALRFELGAFFAMYLVASIGVDQALKRYGRDARR